MYLPHAYPIALLFMVSTMLCWGSWANTLKLCPGYRFQLFYWDYIVGLLAGATLLGLTLGSTGSVGNTFLVDIASASRTAIIEAVLGGVIFNFANILLVAAIEIAGMAVAFPVGIGLALIIGTVSSYVIAPQGNPWLLFGGVALVMAAILCSSLAYRKREAGKLATTRTGIVLSLVSGILMGSFYPLVTKAMTGEYGSGKHALGPYATAFFFVIGAALCSLPVNYFFMKRPVDTAEPVSMNSYWQAKSSWHLWGIVGGLIWVTGTVLNFAASRVHLVGPAISYSIGQGATMISACWGVFVWREFRNSTAKVTRLLIWMFVCFVLGLGAIAVAPLFVN